MFFTFLAKTTSEIYRELAIHPRLIKRWSDPFDPALFKDIEPGTFCPLGTDAFHIALLLMFFAIVLLWCGYRVSTASVYRAAGWAFAALSVVVAAGFRGAFPGTFSIVLACAILLLIYTDLTIIAAVTAIRNLTYTGLKESFITDPRNGNVTWMTMLGSAIAAFIVFASCIWYICGNYAASLFGYGTWMAVPAGLACIGFGYYFGKEYLPWHFLEDHPLVGEAGFYREIENIYIKDGEASLMEIMGAGFFLCIVLSCCLVLFKGSIEGSDIFGMISIFLICLVMVKSELNRSVKEDALEDVRMERSKDAWS